MSWVTGDTTCSDILFKRGSPEHVICYGTISKPKLEKPEILPVAQKFLILP